VEWDEGPDVGGDYGPYYQSQRLDRYHRAAEKMVQTGAAYRCYCTTERLGTVREEQRRRGQSIGYDRLCRHLTADERQAREASKVASVVRFAMPADGVTEVTDVLRGQVAFENRLVDDFVILKADSFPTYHLASVVDDHDMEISHVLRAEEWLPSAPRHVLIYQALGLEPPQFVHLPIILAPDRSKLSKRHGATSVLEYRRMGYLPQAMVNFLALLGWSLDDKTEILSLSDLTKRFSLERISKAGAVFDSDKLGWMNGHYIRQLTHDDLADALLDYWHRYPPEGIPELPDKPYLLKIVPLIQERIKLLQDAAPLIAFFFKPELGYETRELIQKKMDADGTRNALQGTLSATEGLPSFDSQSLENALRPLAQAQGIKVGQLLGTLRVATTGLQVSPPLFETMAVLGRERSLSAIREAIDRL
jgi:glutamyl-tRNA synthetase